MPEISLRKCQECGLWRGSPPKPCILREVASLKPQGGKTPSVQIWLCEKCEKRYGYSRSTESSDTRAVGELNKLLPRSRVYHCKHCPFKTDILKTMFSHLETEHGIGYSYTTHIDTIFEG